MNAPKIKICGNCFAENIKQVAKLAPDYMGFIFYKESPRFVEQENSIDQLKNFPKIQKVAVFVNATIEEIQSKIKNHSFSLIQLHGTENPDFCKKVKSLGVKVIKVFRVDAEFHFSILRAYENIVDYFLFDTKGKGENKEKYGGLGVSFDWNILQKYDASLPVFLSGGLNLKNIKQIPNFASLKIHALDLNSRFETSPGIKDLDLLRQLLTIQ